MSSDTNKLLTEWKACKEWAQQDKVQNVLKFYYEMPTSNQISWNIPGTDWRKFLSPKGKYFYVNAVTRAICWDIQEVLGVSDPFCAGPSPPQDDLTGVAPGEEEDAKRTRGESLLGGLRIEDITACVNCSKPGSVRGERGVKLLRCGRCKISWYCSYQCQRTHWPKHSLECKLMEATSEGTAERESVAFAQMGGKRPRPPPRLCEQCEQADFLTAFCPMCDQWTCEECDVSLHDKGARTAHQRLYREEDDDTYMDKVAPPASDKADERRLSTLPDADQIRALKPSPPTIEDPWAGATGKRHSAMVQAPDPEGDRESVVVPALPTSTRRHASNAAMDKTSVEEVEEVDLGEVLMEGTLKQRAAAGMLRNNWKERYFVLFRNEILVYQNKRKAEKYEKLHSIPIAQISEVQVGMKGAEAGPIFQLVDATTGKQMLFHAGTSANATKWSTALLNLLLAGPRTSTDSKASASPSSPSVRSLIKPPGTPGQPVGALMFGDIPDGGEADGLLLENIPYRVVKEWKPYAIATGDLFLAADPEVPDTQVGIYMVKKSDPLFQPIKDALTVLSKQDNHYILSIQHLGFSSDAMWAIYPKPGDSVARFLNKVGHFPETALLVIAAQLVLALEFLHERHLTANSLSTTTVFLDSEDGRAVLGDVLMVIPASISQQVERPEYTCPDSSNQTNADWWRLGVTLYEMAVGMPPFTSDAADEGKKRQELNAQRDAFDNSKLPFPEWVSEELRSLIRGLLHKNKAKRLGAHGAHEVQEQAFFVNGGVFWHNVDASLNTWLNDHVVDQQVVNYTAAPEPSRWTHKLTMELISASNLPIADKNDKVWCQVSGGDQKDLTTDKQSGAHPNWGKLLTFRFTDLWEAEVTVELIMLSKKKQPETIGSVSFSLHSLQSAMALLPDGKELALNSCIIGPDGMTTYAELQTAFHLSTEPVPVPPRELDLVKLPFQQSFENYFGKIQDRATVKKTSSKK